MNEKINEKISVVTVFDREKRTVMPQKIKWQGRIYIIDKIGYHHKVKQGKKLLHIFSVSNNSLAFRLELDTETLFWTLQEVSDGLASEVGHICEQSGTGAVIYKDNIPIKDETRRAAEEVGKDPYDYALYGGEDFELVFTVSEKNLRKVRGFLVGEITKRKGLFLYEKGKESRIKGNGYDHFKKKNKK